MQVFGFTNFKLLKYFKCVIAVGIRLLCTGSRKYRTPAVELCTYIIRNYDSVGKNKRIRLIKNKDVYQFNLSVFVHNLLLTSSYLHIKLLFTGDIYPVNKKYS